MSFCWHFGHNKFHIGNKTHIQHPIRFIQDNSIEFGEVNKFSIDQIFQPTWSTNNKIILPLTKFSNLSTNGCSTHATSRKDSQISDKSPQFLIDLYRQFPRWYH